MSRELFGVEKGLLILGENENTGVSYIKGTALPGLLDQENDALMGSLYSRDNGEIYAKIQSGSGQDKWKRLLVQSDLEALPLRVESIVVATGDAAPISGSVINLTTNPFGDDETPLTVATDFVAGTSHILFGVGGVPKLMKVSVVASPSITVVDADDALADEDRMIVSYYLPDSAGDQEAQAYLYYKDATIFKLGDINWAYANGINLAAGYAANPGNVTSSDTVQSAVAKLDGINDSQDLALGLAQGATNFGTFTGSLLADTQGAKALFQALETEAEAVRTLSGTASGALHLGTFTGDTIPDSSTVKAGLQALETKLESIELQKTITGITTEVSVDELLCDDFQASKWEVVLTLDSDPSRLVAMEVLAAHNGTGASDATTSDNNAFGKLKIGATFAHSVAVDINGVGAAQVMRLRVSATNAVTARVRRIVVYA
jgi:hypothetical protein